ncbi:MAG: HEAT repeat domain-containing protein [Pyrinomonadaceae bacterium]|nr:HEAT repeat domain-containing protein [Pyrinomonadaceae bacterium]
MLKNERNKILRSGMNVFFPAILIAASSVSTIAQQKRPVDLQPEGQNWTVAILAVLVGCLVIAIYFKFKNKSSDVAPAAPYKRDSAQSTRSASDLAKLGRNSSERNRASSPKPAVKARLNGEDTSRTMSFSNVDIDQLSATLPIYSFLKLKAVPPFKELPVSNDPSLLNAIEQIRDEFEEDEEIRSIAVRILAAFKTRNSVEALSQVALYDLSANVRSSAVTTLSEFDHESVFDTILLACADPSREVRAASARALFHLTFDRAQSYARIANSSDRGRVVQMARAAIAADLVERSFERLIHRDRKYAYEAFAMVIMLIRAGEMEEIVRFLKKSTDTGLRRALLHTIKSSKNKHGLDALNALMNMKGLTPEFQEEIDKTVEEMGFVTV